MNNKYTRNLIALAILAATVTLGLFALVNGLGAVAASIAVVAALATLVALELRGASRRLPRRQPKGSIELYRSEKSEA